MKNKIAWLLILLSIALRLFQFDGFPFVYSSDSTAHSWAGVQMLEGEDPASMSLFIDQNPKLFWFSHYNYFDTVRKLDFRLVDPYLDQPPLAMPLVGSFPALFGYSDFREFPTGLVRIPAILASALSLILLWHIAKRFFSKNVGLVALAIFGLTPYFVFAHRESFIENFLTPLYLGALLLLDSYLKRKSWPVLVGLIFLSVAAGLFKTVGFIVPLTIGFWLLKNKQYKETALIAVALLVSTGIYWLWGNAIDASQFAYMMDVQSTRGFSLNSVLTMMTAPMFYEPFIDGWYLLGFVAFFAQLLLGKQNKKTTFIYTSALFFFIPVLLTIGKDNNFPWYRYPLFPFVSLATAQVLIYLTKHIDLGKMVVVMMFTGSNLHILLGNEHPIFASSLLRIVFALLLVPVVIHTLVASRITQKLAQLTVIGVICLSLLLNMVVILKYPQSRCIESHCMLPIKMVIEK